MPSDDRSRGGVRTDQLVGVVERTGARAHLVDPTGEAGARPVATITHDSRRVEPGAVFACLRGDNYDGHQFAAAAVAAGAAVLLVDHELPGAELADVAQLVVEDTRLVLGPLAARVYGEPSGQLVTVGITGTNGKTTTAHLLAAVFEANGWPCGVVGTLRGARTTPEAPELQATLAGFVDDGLRAAVLEVSSHALALHRIDGTRFDAVVFTNLGRDHLDLHGSQEEYFRAKAALFSPRFSGLGVINTDDLHGRLLADAAGGPEFRIVPFGVDQVEHVRVAPNRHTYRWRGTAIEVPIGGAFNVANSLAAVTVAAELGVSADVVAEGLAGVEPVPGRFELVTPVGRPDPPFSVVVDYAHTPDGLVELLASARSVAAPGRSVVVVFGCGGERDHDKRPEMGAVAARLADRVIVTSDNPRHEEPAAIIDEIVAGIDDADRERVSRDPDRRAAIRSALAGADAGDVVVIAGKGHESTQDLGRTIVEFDDRAVARAVLEEMP